LNIVGVFFIGVGY